VDARSRMDYLRQKVASEARMRTFDELPDYVRAVATGAPTFSAAIELYRRGVRTFEGAERAIAGVG
jgi:hypothetical protein